MNTEMMSLQEHISSQSRDMTLLGLFSKYEQRLLKQEKHTKRRIEYEARKMASRFDDLANSTTSRLDDLANSTTSRLDDLSNSTTSRLDDLSNSTTSRLDDLANSTTSRLDDLANSSTSRLDAITYATASRLDDVKVTLEEIDSKVRELVSNTFCVTISTENQIMSCSVKTMMYVINTKLHSQISESCIVCFKIQ